MRFKPCARSSLPFRLQSPRNVGARHLMKSSSTPPAVVTSTSIILFFIMNTSCSRTPEEIKFEVNPRKIFARTFSRYAGSFSSSESSSPTGSSLRRHFNMRFTSSTARPSCVAWNPEVSMASSSFCASKSPSKS